MTHMLSNWPEYRLPEELQTPEKLPSPSSFGDEWAIVSAGVRPPGWIEVVITLCWTVMVIFVLLPRRSFASGDWLGIVVPVVFAASGIGMWYRMVSRWFRFRRGQRFGSPILLLSQQRYRSGETLDLSFQRDLKPDNEVRQNGTLSARLVCVEITRRTVGTDTTYDHTVHYEKDLGQQPVFSGTHQLRATWRESIPGNARPTLMQKDHWVLWEVQVRQNIPGQLDEITDFLIPVVN